MLVKPQTRTADDGLQMRATAKLKRATAESFDNCGDHWHAEAERVDAGEADRLADEILTLPHKPKIGTGGELHLSDHDAAWKPGLACK